VICFIFIATVQAVQIDWGHDFKGKTQKEFFPFFKRVYEENHPDHLIDLQDGKSISKIILNFKKLRSKNILMGNINSGLKKIYLILN